MYSLSSKSPHAKVSQKARKPANLGKNLRWLEDYQEITPQQRRRLRFRLAAMRRRGFVKPGEGGFTSELYFRHCYDLRRPFIKMQCLPNKQILLEFDPSPLISDSLTATEVASLRLALRAVSLPYGWAQGFGEWYWLGPEKQTLETVARLQQQLASQLAQILESRNQQGRAPGGVANSQCCEPATMTEETEEVRG